jgi:hypothetical protein
MSLTHVDPNVSEIVMVWIQSGDRLMVWIQICLTCLLDYLSTNILLPLSNFAWFGYSYVTWIE